MDLYKIEDIRNLLLSNLGKPDSDESLDAYIKFILENRIEKDTDDLYTENHHVLPQSVLQNDFTVKLAYNDHCAAHFLLFLAYNRNDFQRTLNWMKPSNTPRGIEYSGALSKARKRGWVKFKASNKYVDYVETMSIRASERMRNGQASYMSDLYHSKPETSNEISDHFKTLWSNTDYRKRIIASMIKERNSKEGRERLCAQAQKYWATMTEEKRAKFKETMTAINRDLKKREDAGKKIKEKWKDPEFREKMKGRRHGSNSKSLKEKWKDPEFREMMLNARKIN